MIRGAKPFLDDAARILMSVLRKELEGPLTRRSGRPRSKEEAPRAPHTRLGTAAVMISPARRLPTRSRSSLQHALRFRCHARMLSPLTHGALAPGPGPRSNGPGKCDGRQHEGDLIGFMRGGGLKSGTAHPRTALAAAIHSQVPPQQRQAAHQYGRGEPRLRCQGRRLREPSVRARVGR